MLCAIVLRIISAAFVGVETHTLNFGVFVGDSFFLFIVTSMPSDLQRQTSSSSSLPPPPLQRLMPTRMHEMIFDTARGPVFHIM